MKVQCSSDATRSRILFYSDAECKTRVPSDGINGEPLINMDDKCFKGANYIRAYCQTPTKVNDLSNGEKEAEACKKDKTKCPDYEKKSSALSLGALSNVLVAISVFAFLTI